MGSLVKAVTYDARAVADMYIDKQVRTHRNKRHMLMSAKTQKNPQFGFVKFNIPPPTYAGVSECKAIVMRAEVRLTVLSVPMKDVMVYHIPSDKADFINESWTSKYPGTSAYDDLFNNSLLVNHAHGPVAPKKNFTIDVTEVVSKVFEAGGKVVSFGLETSTAVSRFCAQSKTRPRTEGWCYPKLEVLLGLGDCPVAAQDHSCSTSADSNPGPLDAMCSGDQCCPDGSTCPSSSFAQAQGCNLKKYDCTAPLVPANWTCRESEEVFCPGTDITCSGDTCCPNNTTCPSASVMQVPSCEPKTVDCQAPLSEDATCAIGEYVFCPGTTDRCFGNQCCPDGSTCPSAPDAIAEGCGPKKASCELLEWNVKLRVTSIIFAKVANDTKDLVDTLCTEAIAAKAGLDANYVTCFSSEGEASTGNVTRSVPAQRRLAQAGMTLNAKVTAPGGWSQKKLDSAVESKVLSEDFSSEMQEMLTEIDGLQEASSGDMAFEQIEAERSEVPSSSTPSPQSNDWPSTPSPQSNDSPTKSPNVQSTSLRGGDAKNDAGEQGGEVTSLAAPYSTLPPLVALLLNHLTQYVQ